MTLANTYSQISDVATETDLRGEAAPVETGAATSNLSNAIVSPNRATPNPNRTVFMNPDDNMGIGFATWGTQIWIHLHAVPIKEQKNFIRPGQPTIVEKAGQSVYDFKFLAPQELVETLSHEWGPFESISQSIQQMYGQTLVDSLNVLKAAKQSLSENSEIVKDMLAAVASGQLKWNQVKDTASELVRDFIEGQAVQPWRVDTPLIYKNTERRTYEFPFNLISVKGDPYNEVVEPVKLLMKLSCPEKPEDATTGYNPIVIPPYVFKITTATGDDSDYHPLIHIPYAALRSVNPVWKGPYMDNFPTRCELRLSLQEIEPVYARSIETSTVIKVESTVPPPAIWDYE